MRLPASVKADYLNGMTPKEICKKHKKFNPKQVSNYAQVHGWVEERRQIMAKQSQIISEISEAEVRKLKDQESSDMDLLIKKAKTLLADSKPSAYRTKHAAEIMKIAYERKYKALNIPDKVQHGGDSKNPIKHEHEVIWPQL